MSAAASASDDAAPQLTVQIKGPSELRLHITIAADATVRQLKERIQQEKSDVTAER
jgi:ubiquilin